jgi:hypothetical protein
VGTAAVGAASGPGDTDGSGCGCGTPPGTGWNVGGGANCGAASGGAAVDEAISAGVDRAGRLGTAAGSAPPGSGSGTTLMDVDADCSASGVERPRGAAH